MRQTWSIFSMVKETRPVLERFVDHHLGIGASYIHLFFDDPDDPAYDHFAKQAGVIAVRCDKAHWHANQRVRPRFQERRQLLNGAMAYNGCLTQWQAHIDSDELFSFTSDVSMSETLGELPETCHAAWFAPIEPLGEATTKDGTIPFKLTTRHLRWRHKLKVYGDDFPLLREGFLGHTNGKSVLRAGMMGWTHGIHTPRHDLGRELKINLEEITNGRLAHMHCETKADWLNRTIDKYARRNRGVVMGRYNLIGELLERQEQPPEELSVPDILSDFFDRIAGASVPLVRRLRRFDLLEYHRLPSLQHPAPDSPQG